MGSDSGLKIGKRIPLNVHSRGLGDHQNQLANYESVTGGDTLQLSRSVWRFLPADYTSLGPHAVSGEVFSITMYAGSS